MSKLCLYVYLSMVALLFIAYCIGICTTYIINKRRDAWNREKFMEFVHELNFPNH